MKAPFICVGDDKYIREDLIERSLPEILSTDVAPWLIGKNYLIRTVTMTDTGRLVAVTDKELVLEDAAWVADTGRFSNALLSGNFEEVEPFPAGRVILNRSCIIEGVEIAHLPRTQK